MMTTIIVVFLINFEELFCVTQISMPNLENGAHGPVIYLEARSLLPVCYVDLEESDYLTAGRRNQEVCGSKIPLLLEPSTVHVLEMEVLGVGVTSERSFAVVNPTDKSYSFEWVNKDSFERENQKQVSFRCDVPFGNINPGKQIMVSSAKNGKYRKSELSHELKTDTDFRNVFANKNCTMLPL
jgi:hypothetical protein